ncbi:MAG: V-type ATPase subunit [Lachnospiraceae bacterium]|nr:V-type ATPase subunit [Lachnospiraceae bacterium]MCD8250349.1 V-type ATPase subunit [Lachnospiraceae bacterium]
MSDTQYTYAVARTRALETTLFSSATLDQLMACKDYDACLQFILDKGWGGEDVPRDADAILASEESKIWERIREMGVDMKVFDVLSYTNLYHNLKAAVKEAYTGKSSANIYYKNTAVSGEDMARIVREHDYKELPLGMQKAAEEAMDTLLHTGDGQLCDVIIDRATMAAIMKAGRESSDDIIRKYAEFIVAEANIKIAVRGAKTGKTLEFLLRAMTDCPGMNVEQLAHAAASGPDAVLEYLESGSYAEAAEALRVSQSAFERWCDNRLIEIIRPEKYKAFSVGPLVAYIIARENEIKTVRIILTGKQNGLPDDSIRERVREMYV